MFKMLVLSATTPEDLDNLQKQYDIIDVRYFGNDDQNRYILVQTATKVPDSNDAPKPPVSGSATSGSNA